MTASAIVRVVVVYVDAAREIVVPLSLPAGATVADAIDSSEIAEAVPADVEPAIHGQRATVATPLVDGDRIELVRPLLADPKAVRRLRADERPLPRTPPKRRARGDR